ncbi:hypothetical protein GBW32_12080 [Streptomyces tsukubensis]|uniref:Uncharacterized protein n=1 Tax=Streptomyces tsukubensis TaxID=83656 RepID=A0A1V3ZZC9_9ACTN|nr:hypothetical protein B1H18_32160 [Streptomyces tsukubensis]QFR97690.1 hypothetical protein GBW32_12080 [Streptomyces tsukubensis]
MRHVGRGSGGGAREGSGDVVRWAVFSSALVPVVLVVYGSSLVGAAGTAVGLAAITAACRLLLRQSERGAARSAAERSGPHRGRHGRTGAGTHRGAAGAQKSVRRHRARTPEE